MKKAAALWVCICLSIIDLAQTEATAGGVTRALIQQSFEAWSTMDTNKIASYYSKAPENIFFDIAPMQYKGWEEWAKGVENLFTDYKSFKLSLASEPAIHNPGHLGLVHRTVGTQRWQDGNDRRTRHCGLAETRG